MTDQFHEDSMNIVVNTGPANISVNIQVASNWAEPVYLTNCIRDWFGVLGDPKLNAQTNHEAPPTTQIALTCWGSDAAILLQGEGPPPPRGISMMVPKVPRATRLMPGGTCSWKISLPLPLLEWSEYQSPKTADTERTPVHRIRVRVGYIKHTNAHDPDEHPSFKGMWRVIGYPVDHLEATADLTAPIIILKRSDAFKRFG
jgi:hypothetical protein